MEVISGRLPLVMRKSSNFSTIWDPTRTLRSPVREDTRIGLRWQTRQVSHSLAQEIRVPYLMDKTPLAISRLPVITWLKPRDATNHQKLKSTWVWYLSIREGWTTDWLNPRDSCLQAMETKLQLWLKLHITTGHPHLDNRNSPLSLILSMIMLPVTKLLHMPPKRRVSRKPYSQLSLRLLVVLSHPLASLSCPALRLPLLATT